MIFFLMAGINPLPEPMLTSHQWGLLIFISGYFHRKFARYLPLVRLEEITATSPRGQWINSFRPIDAIWWHWSGSTLAQVMACCLSAPSHYLTNVDLSSVRLSGIHLRAISQEIPQPPFTKVSLKITYLKLNWNLPGANELTHWPLGDLNGILDN